MGKVHVILITPRIYLIIIIKELLFRTTSCFKEYQKLYHLYTFDERLQSIFSIANKLTCGLSVADLPSLSFTDILLQNHLKAIVHSHKIHTDRIARPRSVVFHLFAGIFHQLLPYNANKLAFKNAYIFYSNTPCL